MKMLQADVEQIVPFVLARAGYERRRMSAEPDGECEAPVFRVSI